MSPLPLPPRPLPPPLPPRPRPLPLRPLPPPPLAGAMVGRSEHVQGTGASLEGESGDLRGFSSSHLRCTVGKHLVFYMFAQSAPTK
jgi:hypothetical protein